MIAKSKGKGLNLVEGYINKKNYKISKAKYDAFICMSFLEHAPKLNTFLQGIHNNLNDKSYGIIEVPNFDMISEFGLFNDSSVRRFRGILISLNIIAVK